MSYPFTTPKVTLYQGLVDSETGRGRSGSADEVLVEMPSGSAYPQSDPVPQVTITSASIGIITRDGNEALVANIHVQGFVVAPYADIVPANEADPTQVKVIVGGRETGTLSLTRVAEAITLLRPYAARFAFSGTVSAAQLIPLQNAIVVKVEDVASGNVGWDSWVFDVVATRNPGTPNDDIPIRLPEFFYHRVRQPFKFLIDSGEEALIDLFEAVSEQPELPVGDLKVYARRVQDSDDPTKEWTASVLGGDAGPIIRSRYTSDPAELEILATDVSEISDGVFHAEVKMPGLCSDPITVVFERTNEGGTTWASRIVDMIVQFASSPTPDVIDTIDAQVRKTLWDSAGSWESAELEETGPNTLVFGGSAFEISIVQSSFFFPGKVNDITVTVTNTTLGLDGDGVDLTETGVATLIFKSELAFATPSIANEYGSAWFEGPWEASPPVWNCRSQLGVYTPVMILIEGVTDLSLTCQIFGVSHGLVEMDGYVFCAGSGEPGVFASGFLKSYDTFGAGHINKSGGFTWATLGGSIESQKVYVYNTARRLFATFVDIGRRRYQLRQRTSLSGYAYWGRVYGMWDDPRNRLAKLIWYYFEEARKELGKPGIDDAVRARALDLMTQHDSRQQVFGIPNTPNNVYVHAAMGGISNRFPDASRQVLTVGSQHLIGHWYNIVFDPNTDYLSQRQNVTSILHMNSGLGWGKLQPIVEELIHIIQNTSGPDRGVAIMEFMRRRRYVAALKNAIEKAAGTETAERVMNYNDSFVFAAVVANTAFYKELVLIAEMLKRTGAAKVDAFIYFLNYDIVSNEGFDYFGIDGLNDVIATEMGNRLALELGEPGSTIVDEDTLKARLEYHMQGARERMIASPTFSDKAVNLRAFFSVMMANDGRSFVPVSFVHKGDAVTLWPQTMGTVLEKNITKLTTEATESAFRALVESHMDNLYSHGVNTAVAVLSEDDVLALHNMVEVISLISP